MMWVVLYLSLLKLSNFALDFDKSKPRSHSWSGVNRQRMTQVFCSRGGLLGANKIPHLLEKMIYIRSGQYHIIVNIMYRLCYSCHRLIPKTLRFFFFRWTKLGVLSAFVFDKLFYTFYFCNLKYFTFRHSFSTRI